MDWIPQLFEQLGLWRGLVVIAVIAIGLWLWRATRDIKITLIDKVEKVGAQTEAIAESIVTNHGSKNMGDAVDRQYEMLRDLDNKVNIHIAEAEVDRAESRAERRRLDRHIEESRPVIEWGKIHMLELESKIERGLHHGQPE